MNYRINENTTLFLAIIIGVVTAIILAPMNKYFFGNFTYFLIPQVIVIGLLFYTKIHYGVITGCLLSMAAVLITCNIYNGFLFFLLGGVPGVYMGAVLFGILIKKHQIKYSVLVILGTIIFSFIGCFFMYRLWFINPIILICILIVFIITHLIYVAVYVK